MCFFSNRHDRADVAGTALIAILCAFLACGVTGLFLSGCEPIVDNSKSDTHEEYQANDDGTVTVIDGKDNTATTTDDHRVNEDAQ